MPEPYHVHLVVLLDASGSMAIDVKCAVAVDALRHIARRWRELDAAAADAADVRLAIVAEGRAPHADPIPLPQLDARLDDLDARGELLPGGRGDLAPAIAWASALAAGERRAILLLSDGHDDVLACEPFGDWQVRGAVAIGADADVDALRTFVGAHGAVVEPAALDRVVFALDALTREDADDALNDMLAPLGVPGGNRSMPTPARSPSSYRLGDTVTGDPGAGTDGVAAEGLTSGAEPGEGSTVTDTAGIVHFLEGRISRGGEGDVYRTRDPRVGVKILRSPAADVDERLAAVRRLPLEGLQVARPGIRLRGADGYVMRLLTGMDTLQSGRHPGLRRTLRVLANAAGVLAGLHARGLVHRDVKPSNVLASTTADRTLVWLIDADNIVYHGLPHNDLHTPDFAAPEGPRGDWFGDRFALAVLVHSVLTGRHPWLGSDPPYDLWQDDWRGEPGLAQDARNEQRGEGRPLADVTDERLRALADIGFGPGLEDPTIRPAARDWAVALHGAADLTLTCENAACPSTYFASSQACPTCGLRRGRVTLVRLHRVSANGAMCAPERPDAHLALRRSEPAWITRRHLHGSVPAGHEERALVHLEVGGSRLKLHRTAEGAALRLDLRPAARKQRHAARSRRGRFGEPQTDVTWVLGEGRATLVGLVAGPGLGSYAIVAEQTQT